MPFYEGDPVIDCANEEKIDLKKLRNVAMKRMLEPPEGVFFTVGLLVDEYFNTLKVLEEIVGLSIPHRFEAEVIKVMPPEVFRILSLPL